MGQLWWPTTNKVIRRCIWTAGAISLQPGYFTGVCFLPHSVLTAKTRPKINYLRISLPLLKTNLKGGNLFWASNTYFHNLLKMYILKSQGSYVESGYWCDSFFFFYVTLLLKIWTLLYIIEHNGFKTIKGYRFIAAKDN